MQLLAASCRKTAKCIAWKCGLVHESNIFGVSKGPQGGCDRPCYLALYCALTHSHPTCPEDTSESQLLYVFVFASKVSMCRGGKCRGRRGG